MTHGILYRATPIRLALAAAVLLSIGGHVGTAADAQEQPPSDLVVHEWGTFLGMNGADGTALDGMYHEEHALPSFVHARSRDQLRLPWAKFKGETPVIYFYTERPQSVRIGVGFPSGVWTQWYPQAARVHPALSDQAGTPDRLKEGRICWYAEIIPPALAETLRDARSTDAPVVPPTSADALWNHAREVDACYVKTIDGTKDGNVPEYERFLFYRGLSGGRLPLGLSAERGGTLTLARDPVVQVGVRHLFVIRVENGRGAYRYVSTLHPGQSVAGVIPPLAAAKPLGQFTRTIADDMAKQLTASGLYPKEARAMVNTWTTSYFQTDGIRVLYVLPQIWTDAFIPMTVVPPPKQIVRVMVGRLELLSPDRERRAEAAIRSLADPESTRRAEAFAYLREQGRYAEPVIRRVLKTSQNESVRVLCKRLLMTDFVTDLRAAIHDAADGRRLEVDAVLLRAHLGRLLRDIGLDREAKIEGVAILKDLERARAGSTGKQPAEPDRRDVRAAALEATGIDRSAAYLYGECIQTQAASLQDNIDSGTVAFYREWWVGRAYGRSMLRAGQVERVRTELEAKLAHRGGSLRRADFYFCTILLAYLHEAQGERAPADRLWSSLEGKTPAAGEPRVASRSSAP
jgi:hypothetical protein